MMNQADLELASGGVIRQTKYIKKNPLRQHFIQQYLHSVESLAERVSANSILDVGCGEGFVIRHLNEARLSQRIVGIDLQNDVLRVAQFQNQDEFFAEAGAYQLPFVQGSFDLVLCNEVLEHLDSPETAITEIMRVGKDDFIFSVPQEPHYRIANMIAGSNWSRWGDDIDHCQRWTVSQFVQMLGRWFDIIEVKNPFPWIMVLCKRRG